MPTRFPQILLPSYGLMFPQLARKHFELGRARQIAELMTLHQQISQIVPRLFGTIDCPARRWRL